MIDWLVATNGGVVPLILRLTLAVVMFPHGAQKTLGWFGGYRFRAPRANFTKSRVPPALAFPSRVCAFLGPPPPALGLRTARPAAGVPGRLLLASPRCKQPR